MQINDLAIEIQNKIFYFLEHPIAAIIRNLRSWWVLEFHNMKAETEAIRFYMENCALDLQLRHKLKVRFITEEDTKKLDPLFLHMNKEQIEAIIKDHEIQKIRERRYLCPECELDMKDCKCDPFESHRDCDDDCICKGQWRR